MVAALRNDLQSPSLPVLILVVTTLLVGWMLVDTSYTVTTTDLLIRGAFLRHRVSSATSRRVRRS